MAIIYLLYVNFRNKILTEKLTSEYSSLSTSEEVNLFNLV